MDDYIYLEFLVEDKSGEILLKRILDNYKKDHSNLIYRINSFKGIGRIPKKPNRIKNIKTQRLLNDLPSYLKGFSASLMHLPYKKAIIVIVDNDDNNCIEFKDELNNLKLALKLSIDSIFCIAIEEMEAWLLGDIDAVITAYPHARKQLLQNYVPDSIIGTWEYLAEAIYNGGIEKLKRTMTSYYEIGEQKCIWADEIGAYLNLRNNRSPSFNHLLSKLDMICGKAK